jgi:hypothetical protein
MLFQAIVVPSRGISALVIEPQVEVADAIVIVGNSIRLASEVESGDALG